MIELRACRLLTRCLDLVLGVAGRLGDIRRDAGGQAGGRGDWLDVVPVLAQQVPDLGDYFTDPATFPQDAADYNPLLVIQSLSSSKA
jgi:hypothetical protein